jgi:hypothetical protein
MEDQVGHSRCGVAFRIFPSAQNVLANNEKSRILLEFQLVGNIPLFEESVGRLGKWPTPRHIFRNKAKRNIKKIPTLSVTHYDAFPLMILITSFLWCLSLVHGSTSMFASSGKSIREALFRKPTRSL